MPHFRDLDGASTLASQGTSSRSSTRSSGSEASCTRNSYIYSLDGQLLWPQPESRSIRRKGAQPHLIHTNGQEVPGIQHLSSKQYHEPQKARASTMTDKAYADFCNISPEMGLADDHPSSHSRASHRLGDDPQYANYSVPTNPKHQLLHLLVKDIPDLLGTFAIVKAQHLGPSFQVRASEGTSGHRNLAAKEPQPWQIKTERHGKDTNYLLTVTGDLLCREGESPRSTHRFVGQLDITRFVDCFLKPDIPPNRNSKMYTPDVWLVLAYEEMDAKGIRRHTKDPRGRNGQADDTQARVFRAKTHARTRPIEDSDIPELDLAVKVLKSIHSWYFVITLSDDAKTCAITHLSPSLLREDLQSVLDPELFCMVARLRPLRKGTRFMTKVCWTAPGCPDNLYCIPMFGQQLDCWLCFLVDPEMPMLWE